MLQLIYLSVLFVGLAAALLLYRSKWPGWIGLPFVLLVAQCVRDIGLSPMAVDLLDLFYSHPILMRTSPASVFPSSMLIFLSYFCIGGGMACVRIFWPKDSELHSSPITDVFRMPTQLSRGWKVSLSFFLIGFLANIAVIALLLPGRGFLEIASERAVYTDEDLLTNRWFHYARNLSLLMQSGALGMLLFSHGGTRRIKGAVAANLLYIFFQAIFGGRARVIAGFLTMLMAYHYGVRRIDRSQLIKFIACLLGFLVFISMARFGATSIMDSLLLLPQQLLITTRLDQVSFTLWAFPDIVPFTGAINIIGSIMRFLPTVSIPGTTNFWYIIVENFFGGSNPHGGIGGENWATAAELYTWGGLWTLVAFATFAGILYGCIFEWQRRRADNRFIMLFAILAVPSFLFGTEARLPVSIGGTCFMLVPIALMSALTFPNRYGNMMLFLVYFDMSALLAYVGFRDQGISLFFIDTNMLKFAVIATLPAVYYLSLKAMNRASLPPSRPEIPS